MRHDLPTGTVTFAFTDIEGSTQLLEDLGTVAYGELLANHHRVCRVAWAERGGVEVDTAGDAFFVAFPTASGALAAAAAAQEALAGLGLRVRIGLHTGEVSVGETGYVGFEVHRAARIAAAAHGGQVVVSASTAAVTGRNGLVDLGEHRLKDLAAAERLFQLGEREFPPLRTLYRSNLPVPATPFVGRERELAEVVHLLASSTTRLLTLIGPGGTGKTRLALQAAAGAADEFPDGVWWVPLAPVRDPALVLPAVAHALEIREQPDEELVEVLAERLAGKRTLIVLDNGEHLLPVLAHDVARLLREDAPRLMVTSRERLDVEGEQLYDVPALAPSDAVELFLTRAEAHGRSLRTSPSVEALCRRLEELPLAVELAAARTRVFSVDQLLERIGERLDLLKGARNADPRQQTLRTTIEWSYDLLDPAEQRLLGCLSVFAGGCTFAAAEAVCDADPDGLQSLIDKSLLRVRADEAGETRYWMLEMIREYAAERLKESGLWTHVRREHATWYVTLGRSLEQQSGVTDQAGIERLRSEQPNVRAALEFSLANDDFESVARLIYSSWAAWLLSGLGREGADWARRALARREELSLDALLKLMSAASELMRFSGERAEAFGWKLELLSLERGTVGVESAGTLCDLADMALEDGNLVEARTYVDEALGLQRTPRALASLGDILLHEGQLDDAERVFAEARDGFLGQHGYNHACMILLLGDVARRRGDRVRSMDLFSEAFLRFRELGDQAGAGDAIEGIATLVFADDETVAARLIGGARRLREEWGRPPALHGPIIDVSDREVEVGRGMSIEETIELARDFGASFPRAQE